LYGYSSLAGVKFVAIPASANLPVTAGCGLSYIDDGDDEFATYTADITINEVSIGPSPFARCPQESKTS
jgi:hypothetical protein